ncbi:hypothetical protein EW026_g7778 [Hermanssonia centrifuga]|uniref:Uncharacterized protein n=1 Tax=Hermanssonia centrifuga TaxID=98765 RepID=A0A4S4KB17_9APHY|nr:hypothetical protein EW026_g7778 [Hermanssonia centrifuga]
MSATRVTLPTLVGPLTHSTVSIWLNTCADTFEAATLLDPNAASTLTARARITLAGLKMAEDSAATWWNENREDLKLLSDWDEFATHVRDRFVPASWRLDALDVFYAISQGSSDFRIFVNTLQSARNSLAGAGAGYAINDSIMKHHILFRAHHRLRLQVRASPAFKYENTKLDALISLMQTTYDSLVAEGAIRSASSTSTFTVPTATTPSPAAGRSPLPDLTPAERDRLKAAVGCFHCCLTPGSPGWVPHSARQCPGLPARGIPPPWTPTCFSNCCNCN